MLRAYSKQVPVAEGTYRMAISDVQNLESSVPTHSFDPRLHLMSAAAALALSVV
jgi:hypothetical protein